MYKEIIENFWKDIYKRDWEKLENYFHEDAVIDWINTNERFDPKGFIAVNYVYTISIL